MLLSRSEGFRVAVLIIVCFLNLDPSSSDFCDEDEFWSFKILGMILFSSFYEN